MTARSSELLQRLLATRTLRHGIDRVGRRARSGSLLPTEADAYRALGDRALLWERIRPGPPKDAVSVLLPSVRPNLSAGPRTAIELAASLAERLARPLRIVTTGPSGQAPEAVRADLQREFSDVRVRFAHIGDGAVLSASEGDLWIATAWETAFAADVAARLSRVRKEQVVYLIQDYEPAFYPWSTEFALAQSTYHAGFHNVVNSTTLAEYLRQQEGEVVDLDLVLAPALDSGRLKAVAAARRSETNDVFFYARPSTAPRNLFNLGLSVARRAAQLTERPWRLVLAGEDMRAPTVPGVDVEVAGRTTHSGYYELMQRTKVALSLMLSPHPSHPVLDWATSGGWTVTNSFGSARDGLHPRVLVGPAHPEPLGRLLASTIDTRRAGDFIAARTLGHQMDDVVTSLVERLDEDSVSIASTVGTQVNLGC